MPPLAPSLLTAAATALFNLSLPTLVFNSAGVSLQGLNPPVFTAAAGATLYAIHGSGDPAWTWNAPCAPAGCSLYVDTARHVEPSPTPEELKIDVFGVTSDPATGCVAYGFAGAAATGEPAWAVTLPGCSSVAGEGVGGAYTALQASDSGEALAILGYGLDGATLTARAYLVDGQKGTVRWVFDLGAKEKAGQGDISIGTRFVAFVNEGGDGGNPNAARVQVLGVADGALRAAVPLPFFIAAALSDSGDYLVVQNFTHLKGSEPWVMQWDEASSSYGLLHRLALPADGTEYDLWDIAMPPGEDSYVALGWISAIPTALQLRVNAFNLSSGALVTDWHAPPNARLQNNPTIRCDGEYIGLGLWGDEGEAPTIVVLGAGREEPIFSATSPGSMFAV